MANGAESRVTPRHDPSLVLRGEHCTARVRPWSFRPDTAHLVMVQQQSPPTAADLEHWSHRVARLGYTKVRTNALGESMRQLAESAGFREVQELVLLEHLQPGDAPIPARLTRRLAPSAHDVASVIDQQAFGPEWALDPGAIDDVCGATPRHRARFVGGAGGQMAGYAITGRDVRQGFVQRLAVAPDQQRTGVGRALVLDALRWLAFWRVRRVLVNTAVDNHAALELYLSVGFTPLAERLRVLERALA
ncbi:MAG: GNAT family N-acetyltransferase [Ilumatobacteraceae bacterium]